MLAAIKQANARVVVLAHGMYSWTVLAGESHLMRLSRSPEGRQHLQYVHTVRRRATR